MKSNEPLCFSNTAWESALMTLALFLCNPATLIACSISFSFTSAKASGLIGDLLERFSKARDAFLLVVA
jgi:hypothetical protein